MSHNFGKRKMDLEFNKEIWLTPRKTTKEIQLLELQFKIAHNLYPSNILLQKMKIKNTNRCDYCPHEIDFIEHFFYNCNQIKPLWIHIENMINAKIGKNIKINQTVALFGVQKGSFLEQKYINYSETRL